MSALNDSDTSVNLTEEDLNQLTARSRSSYFRSFQSFEDGQEYFLDFEPLGNIQCKFILNQEKLIKPKVIYLYSYHNRYRNMRS